MAKPSDQLLKAFSEIIDYLSGPPGIDWLNHSVSTDHDESIHVVVVNDKIARVDLRLGEKHIAVIPPEFRDQITGSRPARRFELPEGCAVEVERGAGKFIGTFDPDPEDGDFSGEIIERLVLAHACAGIDVSHPSYQEGIISVLSNLL